MALRKMYADMEADVIRELEEEIPLRSQENLLKWALDVSRESYLVLLMGSLQETFAALLEHAEAYAECTDCKEKKAKLAELKKEISSCRKIASAQKEPVQLAGTRAISTAAAVSTTATNALGYLLYGSMCTAYAENGTSAPEEIIAESAEKHLQESLQKLQKVLTSKPAERARIQWECK